MLINDSDSLGIDYNTQRPSLILPEYGRNIQQLAQRLPLIASRQERTLQAQMVVRLMSVQSGEGNQSQGSYSRRVWDHLFIMAGLSLDIDSPFPPPSVETMQYSGESAPVPYPSCAKQVDHYGMLTLKMLNTLCDMDPGEAREALLYATACQMKRNAVEWDRASIRDEDVLHDIERFSQGRLRLPEGTVLNVTQSFKRGKGRAAKVRPAGKGAVAGENILGSQSKASQRQDGVSSRFKHRRGR